MPLLSSLTDLITGRWYVSYPSIDRRFVRHRKLLLLLDRNHRIFANEQLKRYV